MAPRPQYPKKTRGAGAEPRDEAKALESPKNGLYVQLALFPLDILMLIDTNQVSESDPGAIKGGSAADDPESDREAIGKPEK